MNDFMKSLLVFFILLNCIVVLPFVLRKISFDFSLPQVGVWKENNARSKDSRPDFYVSYDWDAICKYEWEQLSTFSFFRRDSAFYFIDQKTVILFHVGLVGVANDFNYKISINVDGIHKTSVKIQGKPEWLIELNKSPDLFLTRIQIPFDLFINPGIINETNLDKLIASKRISLKIHVYDLKIDKGTDRELDLILKYLHRESTKKHSAMVCSRCFYLDKSEAKNIEWWVELQKRIGYEKVSICNNSLEYSPPGEGGFEAVLDKYDDFIERTQMNCAPHYFSSDGNTTSGSHYINSHAGLVNYEGHFDFKRLYLYETLGINMCYLRNAQDYRHIAVIDVDEAFLPPLIEDQFYYHDNFEFVRQLSISNQEDAINATKDLRCNRYTSPDSGISKAGYDSPNQSKVEMYINSIAERDPDYKKWSSLSFQTRWQLTSYSMSRIADEFDKYFNNDSFDENIKYHFIEIKDDSLATYGVFQPFYRFNISGSDEINYAKNLAKLYKLYVKPFMEANKVKRMNSSSLFDRVFTLAASKHFEFVPGKTIHNTMSTHTPQQHVPIRSMFINVNMNVGQVAHFRVKYRIQKSLVFNVRQLMLDLNYMECFYKPMLDDMSIYRHVI